MRWRLALALLLIVAGVPTPATAAPVETGGDACIETEPAEPRGVEIKVYRGPVENSVTLEVNKYDAWQATDSLWGIELPDKTELLSQEGFEFEEGHYQPVQNRDLYRITYTFEENGTEGNTSKEVELRPYEGETAWSVAPLPFDYNGAVSYTTNESAVIGQQTAYFGNFSMTTVQQDCHRIRMVVPDSTELDADVDEVLNSLLYADRRLGGQRYDEVTLFVTPEEFEVNASGVAMGADIVVSAPIASSTDENDHIWLHEYIHTRQTHWPDGEMAWWTESSANYLALQMGLQSGYFSPPQYNELLRDTGGADTGDVVLSQPETWSDFSTYDRGVLVLSRLDHRVRDQTGGSLTMITVFNAVEQRNSITLQNFTVLLEQHTGEPQDQWVNTWIQGTESGSVQMVAETPFRYRVLAGAAVAVIVAVLISYYRRGQDGDDTGPLQFELEDPPTDRLDAIADDDETAAEVAARIFDHGLEEFEQTENE